MKIQLSILIFFLCGLTSRACIWDADTLAQEKRKSPDMAKVILGKATEQVDAKPLRERIATLKASPRENDPGWWNDLAGAHLRLSEAKEAAELLEKVVERFPNDYGIHANLGTAYHLLGRYAEAEKEIARDLEINPDAHFGLEKYHLALLQYLMRNAAYQKEHVYVDEFSEVFFQKEWSTLGLMHPVWDDEILISNSVTNDFPNYRLKWNLASNTNLSAGVIYMASLNPREPACFVMLGIACLSDGVRRDLNLAIAAFQKAIELGSPQSAILERRISEIRSHVRTARGQKNAILLLVIGGTIASFIAIVILRWLNRKFSRRL
jgi:tetratricopeptide (TPR) repeat protein